MLAATLLACFAFVGAAVGDGGHSPIVFQTQTFVRTSGNANTYTATFKVRSWVIAPFNMHIVNGDPNGRERASSVTVTLNGTQVLSPSDLNESIGTLDIPVSPVVGVNTLQVTMGGKRGSEVAITIAGTNSDNVSPSVTVVTPANGSYINTATPKIEITYAKPQGESGDDHADCDETTLKITIDGVDRTPLFTIRKGDASATIPANLALTAGAHTIVATLYDEAKNQGSATSTFTVDLAQPTIQVVQPALGSYLNTITPTIVIQYSDNDGVNLSTLKVSVNGIDLTSLFAKTNTSATATLPASYALSQGAVQIVAQVQDLAGNQATASSSFNVDTTPPTISITHPAANSYRGSPTVPIVVQYTDDQAIDTSKLAITIDGVALATTGVTTTGANATAAGVANGAHVLVATIKDLAGNIGTSQITFYVDTSIPTIHVVQPAPGSLLNASTPSVTVTYTDAVGVDTTTLKIYVNGADATSLFTVTSSSATGQLTGAFALPDGQNTIDAQIANLAGTTGTATSSFTVDTTPPTIAIQAPPARTKSNTPPVTIVYSDLTSGVDPYSLVVTLDGSDVSTLVAPGASSATGVLQLNPPLIDGTHQLSATVKDRAGNRSQPVTLSFVVDTKPPAISFLAPANNSFINNPTPTITLQYSDSTGTGVDTTSFEIFLQQGSNQATDITSYFQIGAQQATGAIPNSVSLVDGTYVLSAVVSDAVGNSANAAATFVVDTVPPTAMIQAPAANAILNAAAVPVTITYSDDRSGIDTSRLVLTVDGVNQTSVLTATATQATGTLPALADGAHTIQLTVYDRSGNASTPISQQFTTDTTPPTILVAVIPVPNAAGWNNTPVTITFNCADSGSGVTTCPSPVAVATDGKGQTFCGQAVDASGNTSAPACATVNLDQTPPAITYSVTPAPNANGIITSTPATITFTCTDALSGVANCNSPIVVNNPGLSQMFTGTATDIAGNSASTAVTLNIQTVAPTPPTIIASLSPAANSKGWNNTNVTVTFTCSAGTNPVSSCPSPVVVSSEGANQSICGKAIDTAGLSSTTCPTVNLDKTPPVITATASPAPSLNGWNTTPVTVTFTCSDALSGIATCPTQQTVSTSGVNETISGTAVDVAGNSSSAHVTLNIDQTPPAILQFSAPSQLAPGQSGTATVVATDNIAVASVVIQMGGTTIATLSAPPYTASFNLPASATDGSTVTLSAIAYDAAGNATSSARGIQVVPSGVVTGQVLSDITGLPFVGATVQVMGGGGQDTSDNQGRYSIASNVPNLFLSITATANSATGTSAMVNIDRQVTLQSGVGTVPVDARMTPIAAPVSISAAGGTLAAGSLTVTVAPNAVPAATNFYLTSLSQQGLPGLLPLGWSPVSAFDLRAGSSTTASFSAAFAQMPASATLQLVQYNYNSHNWLMVTPNLTATSGALTTTIPSVGDFALVVVDMGSGAPTVPSAGQPLTGVSMVTLPAGAAASGTLNPPSASPTGGTSTATLAVQSSVPLPSGTVIQANVSETYSLTSGKQLSSPKRTQDILLYQYSAPTGSAAVANFPVTPSQTFQPGQLSSGDIHLDILSGRESIRGQVGGSDAATVTGGDATLTIAAGSLPQDTAISVSPEGVDGFLPSTASMIPLAEYNIDFSSQILQAPAQLSVAAGKANPGDNVLLAQVQRINDMPYLVVVSLAQVSGSSMVTQAASGLPGITQGGDFVFYKLTSPTGYVSGTVTASSGPVAAMVQTDGLPFVTFANFSGSYLIPALAGAVNLTATVLNTAISGTATVQVSVGQTATGNITVTAQTETATITPANGAVGVPLTAEIDITAPDAFDQSTVTTSSVTLAQNGSGTTTSVPVRFLFSQGGTRLSVFPQSALQPSTTYTLAASGIANTVGGLISIPATTFTTQALTPPTFNTNALVFAMPDQNGNVAISAPAGSFPAGTTILIVDQTNGVVLSLTVLNDGSVTGEMPATINDVLTVTVTAPDKTTTTFTVSQFVAADGTTAVGPGGGTVVGPGGTGIIIPQGALTQGVTFKLTQLDQTAFPVLPSWSGVNFGSGLRIHDPAMPTFQREAKLAFPVPANAPSNAFYYVFRRLLDQNGNAYFETIDQAFVQGSGPNAQVVTASPPFCGYQNSFGKMGVAQAGTPPMPLTLEDQDYFVMWDATAQHGAAGLASTGLIVGRVSEIVPGVSPVTTQPATGVYSVWLNSPNPSATGPVGLTIYDTHCGTFTIFDPLIGGGSRSVTATNGQQTLNATVDEVNGPQTDDGLYSIYAGLHDIYKNVGRVNFLFAAPQQPPPPPQINISIINANTSQPITGIVQTGTPLSITFSSNLSVQSVSINGFTCDGIACPTLSVATPSNPVTGTNYYQLNSAYTPSNLGLTTVSAVAVDPLNPTNPPVTVSRSFLVVEAGGGNTYATPNTPPAVISNYPLPNQQNVATTTFPEITFSEPVVNVPGNVTLRGSPAGDTPAVLLIGTKNDGSIANPVGANDPITSLTIQPLTGLEFGETYTLTLSSGIVNVGTDQNGNSIPQLPLPTYTLSFTTAAPSQLGQGSSANEVITRPVVIGQRAYAGEYLSTTLGGLGIFDISTPSSPIDLGVPATFIGRAIDAVGLAQSPVTGGPLVAVSASATQDLLIPGNVWLYDVSNPNIPVRAGAVSVTNSSTGSGIAVRLAMKDKYLYSSTLKQGLQVIDLSQAIPEFQATPTAQFVQSVTTDGEGFAMDSIINTIQLPIPTTGANPAPCGVQAVCGTATMFGLQADNFVTTGGTQSSVATQTLLVATGQLPLVVADPTLSGTSAILYPAVQYNSPEALSKAPLQSSDGAYQLQQGRAVALTNIAYTDKTGLTTNMHVAVVVGSGTVTTNAVASGASLLAVVDMSQPYTPGSPFTIKPIGFVQLVDQNGNPVVATDVTISGTVACVATGNNILLVNLENPNQPTAAGQINGSFGDWVTMSSSGYLVSTLTTPTNSIQTANLNGSGRPQTGRCRECEKVVGSPINVTNGNVYVEQADYSVPGLGGGIQIDRTWNSLWENSGPVELSGIFGNSWRSTYEERLVFPPPASSSQPSSPPPPVQYWLGDGTVWYFSLSQSANLFYTVSSPATEHATLVPAAALTSSTIYFTDGSKKVFNGAGYLTAMVDRNGNQTTINYDSSNRISTVVSAGGQTLTFNYGAGRQVLSIQDSMGAVASYTYDGSARLTKVLYPDGSALSMNYDPSTDLLTSVTDAQSRTVESHTYDSARRGLTSVRANGVDSVKVQYTGPGQAQVVNSQQISTSYSSAVFGGDNHITQITGPGCSSCGGRNNSSFFYDGSGNRTSGTDAQGRGATLTYDANSNVLSSSVSLGSSTIIWTYAYNNFSEVLTATDPMGNTTTSTYDPNGNLLSVTTPPPGNGAAASVTQFAYNSLGELTQITDPVKHSTALTYTSAGLIQTITDAQGNVITYRYDGRGNRTAVKDTLGNTTSFTYDPMNRLTVITYPDSTTTQFGYDWRGRRISVTDQNGKITNYGYDDADRVTSVTDAAGNTTKYNYDSENNPIAITDANLHTTQFFYNNLGGVTKTTFPSGLSESYTYDNVGNLTAKTDRKGQTIQYSYDSLNRMTTKTYPDGTAVNYTYDNDSQLTKVTDATGTYQFMFDNMGRLIGTSTQYSFLTSKTFTTSYSYDAASNRVGFTDPEGGSTTYGYDSLNRLQTLTPPSAFTAGASANSFGYSYDALSRRKQMTRPNGVATNYAYDNVSRLLNVLHQAGANTLDGTSYAYDPTGNRTGKTDQRTNVTTNYSYDATYELLSATQDGTAKEKFTYDAVGNRLSSIGVAQYSYNTSNELTSNSNGSYTYDANGSPLSDSSGKAFTWDFENRLTSVFVPGTGTTTFKYDPFGRRIQKSGSAGTANYTYDADDQIEETNSSGGVVARYSQSLSTDEPLVMLRSGTADFYDADGLGSVTSLSDVGGTLVQTYLYNSFGATSGAGGITNPFQYTSREADPETGLYYYRYRYYDPTTGRFLNEDPSGFAGGGNFYSYVGNSAIDFVDSYGLAPGDWWDPRSYSYGSMVTKENAWATLKDVGTASEAFADALTFGSASRLNNALGANVAVDRCGIGHKLGAASGIVASIALSGKGLPNAAKGLSNGAKGAIGEGLSTVENTLRGGTRLGTQVSGRALGLSTRFDSVWQSANGTTYYVESKFGTSGLTAAQRVAQTALGDAYHVEKWTYPFLGRIGAYLGAGWGAAGAGRSCGCK